MDDSREWQSQEDLSDDLHFSDNTKELHTLKSEIDISLDPELKLLKDTHTALEVAIKKGDKDREAFMQKYKTRTKGNYLREERLLREDLALQQKLAVEVAQIHRAWISEKIKSLDTQYWYYKNDILPKTKNPQEQQLLNVFLGKLSQLKQVGEHMLTEIFVFQDFIKLMENKKYQGYRELVKLDPWDRYDKEAKAKAKRYATQGPARDVKYALQYLGGNPITQADKGKCAITDEHIDRDEETMKGIVDTATEKFKNKKKNTFIEWTPQSSQEIPVQIGPLEELAKSYDILCQELHTQGFTTTYLLPLAKK